VESGIDERGEAKRMYIPLNDDGTSAAERHREKVSSRTSLVRLYVRR